MNSEERKLIISRLTSIVREAHALLSELINECECEFKPLTEKQRQNEWLSECATCRICGKYHGWRCLKSPDEVCHYFTTQGKVKLINKQTVNVPEGHDSEYESYDWCVFCGNPQERK